MIFSLQRRFLLLLLAPVALILIVAGVAGYIFTRTYLFDQWVESNSLRLEKAAIEIRDQLTDKLELIDSIARAQGIPNGNITQAFLIQQLIQKNGVRFVDLDTHHSREREPGRQKERPDDNGLGTVAGLYTMELCEDAQDCRPVTDPDAVDRTMRMIKVIGNRSGDTFKRLTVRVGFDSFIEPLRQMGVLEGNKALLITGTGQILYVTDRSESHRRMFGETGDDLEKRVLDQMNKEPSGAVFSPGNPPDVVVGFHKVPSINWYLILYSEGSVILAPITRFRLYYAVAATAAIVIIILLIRLTTRQVGRSVGEISAAAAKVGEGDYSVRVPEQGLDEIGKLSRSFNGMIEGLKQRDLMEKTFGRYVDSSFAEELIHRPGALRMGGGEKRIVSVMFADLRDFTAASEKLEPEEVIKLLNIYFARVIGIIQRYRGIIIDFYGDSVLVLFDGVPKDVDVRAADAVRCAVEMQREHQDFLQEIREEGLPELHMGIGIHTGEVIVGNIGTDARAKYGIVGANVNLAARVQSTARGGKIVLSEDTLSRVSERVTVSNNFKASLKGVSRDRELFEVDCLDGVCAIPPEYLS